MGLDRTILRRICTTPYICQGHALCPRYTGSLPRSRTVPGRLPSSVVPSCLGVCEAPQGWPSIVPVPDTVAAPSRGILLGFDSHQVAFTPIPTSVHVRNPGQNITSWCNNALDSDSWVQSSPPWRLLGNKRHENQLGKSLLCVLGINNIAQRSSPVSDLFWTR